MGGGLFGAPPLPPWSFCPAHICLTVELACNGNIRCHKKTGGCYRIKTHIFISPCKVHIKPCVTSFYLSINNTFFIMFFRPVFKKPPFHPRHYFFFLYWAGLGKLGYAHALQFHPNLYFKPLRGIQYTLYITRLGLIKTPNF